MGRHLCLVAMAIVALITIASLLSSMRGHLRCCQASIFALVACHQAGVIALVAMTLLPSMRRCLCHCCDCNCCPYDNGIITVDDVLSSRWRCCPYNNGIIALDPRWCCCPFCDGIVAILKLA
jgi:hypothetical protein